MNNTICPNCSNSMNVPDLYFGRSVKCVSCGSQFTARTIAEIDSERAQTEAARVAQESRLEAVRIESLRVEHLQSIIDFISASDSQHYVELDRDSRDVMEITINNLLKRDLSTWDKQEAAIFRLADQILGRAAFFANQHQARLEELLALNIAKTSQLQDTVMQAASQLASRLEGGRQGTTASGILRMAGEL